MYKFVQEHAWAYVNMKTFQHWWNFKMGAYAYYVNINKKKRENYYHKCSFFGGGGVA